MGQDRRREATLSRRRGRRLRQLDGHWLSAPVTSPAQPAGAARWLPTQHTARGADGWTLPVRHKAPERTPLPNPSPKNPGRIGETQEGANKISL